VSHWCLFGKKESQTKSTAKVVIFFGLRKCSFGISTIESQQVTVTINPKDFAYLVDVVNIAAQSAGIPRDEYDIKTVHNIFCAASNLLFMSENSLFSSSLVIFRGVFASRFSSHTTLHK